MEQGLALPAAAIQVSGFAVVPDLRDVPPYRFPAFDLALILVRHAAALIIGLCG